MKEKIVSLIEKGKYGDLKTEVTNMNEADIAHLFEELDRQQLMIIFRILPKEMASLVFTHLPVELQRYVIESITDREIRLIIDDLFLDDTVDFLEEMPAHIVKKVLINTDQQTRRMINQFLQYPEESAGSIMTIEYVDLKKEMTVKEAILHIKKTGIDKETIDICYVIDSKRILEGILSIRTLILADEDVLIKDIMETGVISVNTHDPQEEIVSMFKKYDFFVMPVVDNENRLVGIVTIDDILDVMDQETTEDFQRMAAMQPSEKEYLKTNAFSLAKHRIPWLLVLMISATFTGTIIRKYDDALQAVMLLAAYIPMLMDTGGNAGTQSSTLIIRGLVLGEIKMNDGLRVLWKEFQVSIYVGLTMASVNFLRIRYIDKVDTMVALTVCSTLLFTVVMAKMVGGLLPLFAKRVGADPAIMASPLITTIVDAMTLIVYFTTATWLLGI